MQTFDAIALISKHEFRRLNYVQLSGRNFNLTLSDPALGPDVRDPATNRFDDVMSFDMSNGDVRLQGSGVEFSYDQAFPYTGITANKPGIFTVAQVGPPETAVIGGVPDDLYWTLRFTVTVL